MLNTSFHTFSVLYIFNIMDNIFCFLQKVEIVLIHKPSLKMIIGVIFYKQIYRF